MIDAANMGPENPESSRPRAGGDRPRVVFLSYYFPPMGGAGTQRTAAFVRHLPAFGYEPVVVCAGEQIPGPHTIAHDASLLAGMPDPLSVTRIPSIERQMPTRRDRWGPRRPVSSVREMAWVRRAADAVVFAARRHDAAAIVISVSPWGCAHAMDEIRRRTGLPVILDLRDPWALDGWRSFRTPLQPPIDRWFMRRRLRTADLVIANCPAAADAYREFAGVPTERLVVIPNGFETDDFPARRTGVRTARPADPAAPFRVVHVGTLHDPDPERARRRHRPGRSGGTLDHHLRSGWTLLRAAGRLRREHPELAKRLRLDFYGSVHPGHRELARAEGIEDQLTVHEYIAHDDVPRVLSRADAIHVPLHGIPAGTDALVVPGKLYEAVASGRPVLATVPPGDACRLIRLAGGDSRVFTPADERGVSGALVAWLEGAAAGWRPEGAPRELLEPFSRRRLTARLAASIAAVQNAGHPPTDDPWIELADIVSRLDGGTSLGAITAAVAARASEAEEDRRVA